MSGSSERTPPVRLLAAVAAVALLLLTVVGCSGGSDQGEGRTCRVNAKGVPSCGVLWGISTRPRSLHHLESLEQQLGRPFDFVYHYLDVDDEFPDHVERAEVEGGRLLHIAIAAREFDVPDETVTWADVANGRFDAPLTAQARGVASLKVPVFVTFAQEGNARDKLGVEGTAADFKAAWRHLHDLYEQVGAKNAVWTWVMTGSRENLPRAASLWPGNDVVDWVSWNVYNASGCGNGVADIEEFVSFEDRMRIFYDFVHRRGRSFGMDPSKPMMISETGTVNYAEDSSLAADWYAAIPSALRKFPQVKAVTLWDSTTSTCDYKFDTSPDTMAGVRRAGLDPSIAIPGALARGRQ